MDNVKQQLENMKIGSMKDIVFSNGILRSTKTLDKISDNLFHFHITNGVWSIAELTLDEAYQLIIGKLDILDLNFL